MNNQLSKEEINTLFEFVESKNVKYRDVQFEIVDHLASAIEEEQTSNDKLSFDKALQEVYSSFPITGFAMMVSAKEAAMSKYWRRQYVNLMLNYFRFPKLLVVGFLTYALQLYFQNAGTLPLIITMIAFVFYYFYCNYSIHKSEYGFKERTENKYLTIDSFYKAHKVISFFIFVPMPTIWSLLTENHMGPYSVYVSWGLAISMTITLVWLHAYTFQYPKMLIKQLSQKYSHLNIKLA